LSDHKGVLYTTRKSAC